MKVETATPRDAREPLGLSRALDAALALERTRLQTVRESCARAIAGNLKQTMSEQQIATRVGARRFQRWACTLAVACAFLLAVGIIAMRMQSPDSVESGLTAVAKGNPVLTPTLNPIFRHGDYASFEAAVSAVPEGGTILVADGFTIGLDQGLRIDKPLRLAPAADNHT